MDVPQPDEAFAFLPLLRALLVNVRADANFVERLTLLRDELVIIGGGANFLAHLEFFLQYEHLSRFYLANNFQAPPLTTTHYMFSGEGATHAAHRLSELLEMVGVLPPNAAVNTTETIYSTLINVEGQKIGTWRVLINSCSDLVTTSEGIVVIDQPPVVGWRSKTGLQIMDAVLTLIGGQINCIVVFVLAKEADAEWLFSRKKKHNELKKVIKSFSFG